MTRGPIGNGIALAAILGITVSLTPALAQNQPPPKQVLFTNVNIFDGKSDELTKNRRVLVEGNLIKTIGDQTLNANKDATVINGSGRTLMPGLIDSHTHLSLV